MTYYLYIVKCSDDSLYTGITTNIEQRVWQHNNSRYGAKYIRGRKPVTLKYKEKYKNKSEAAKREREIKSWRREKKLALIESLPRGT